MASEESNMCPPGGPAEVDNQNNAYICTACALSKAICGGFHCGKYNPGHLNLHQLSVLTGLLGLLKDQDQVKLIISDPQLLFFNSN